jgi:predicted GNAT family N-acyltransferase
MISGMSAAAAPVAAASPADAKAGTAGAADSRLFPADAHGAAVLFEVKRFADLTADELAEHKVLCDESPFAAARSVATPFACCTPSYVLCCAVLSVFIKKRGVLPKYFWDGRDSECDHVLMRLPGDRRLIGTARLFYRDSPLRIGHVGISPDLQRGGYGRRLMSLIDSLYIRGRHSELHAQKYVEQFYASLGWKPIGPDYVEAEIAHVIMQLNIPNATASAAAAVATAAAAAPAAKK